MRHWSNNPNRLIYKKYKTTYAISRNIIIQSTLFKHNFQENEVLRSTSLSTDDDVVRISCHGSRPRHDFQLSTPSFPNTYHSLQRATRISSFSRIDRGDHFPPDSGHTTAFLRPLWIISNVLQPVARQAFDACCNNHGTLWPTTYENGEQYGCNNTAPNPS